MRADDTWSDKGLEVAVIDEAQRLLPRHVEEIMNSVRTAVFLGDPKQRLLADEVGDVRAAVERFRKSGARVYELKLAANHRNETGNQYSQWVEEFLESPTTAGAPPAGYEFRVCDSVHELYGWLEERSQGGKNLARLLASFTESDGKTSRIRVREPEIQWLMEGHEYSAFWLDRGAHVPRFCASVYGCQSFECDYGGLIWGRDLVIRDGVWRVSERHTIQDRIGRRSLMHLVEDGRSEEAVELLKNRYRILLTRGVKGVGVVWEDGAALPSIYPASAHRQGCAGTNKALISHPSF